jgi:hypothetical protein
MKKRFLPTKAGHTLFGAKNLKSWYNSLMSGYHRVLQVRLSKAAATRTPALLLMGFILAHLIFSQASGLSKFACLVIAGLASVCANGGVLLLARRWEAQERHLFLLQLQCMEATH